MELRARFVKKVALGVALLVLAAGISFGIKDALAMREPENSLPQLAVLYNGEQLPAMHVVRDSYSWRFLTKAAVGGIDAAELYGAPFAPVLPDAPLQFLFSYKPNDIVVMVAEGHGPFTLDDYTIMTEYTGEPAGPPPAGRYELYNNELTFTPLRGGQYMLRIWADWGFRGSVLYYVKLDVRA